MRFRWSEFWSTHRRGLGGLVLQPFHASASPPFPAFPDFRISRAARHPGRGHRGHFAAVKTTPKCPRCSGKTVRHPPHSSGNAPMAHRCCAGAPATTTMGHRCCSAGRGQPQRWAINATYAASMGHRCCSRPSANDIGGPWVRFRWSEFLVGSLRMVREGPGPRPIRPGYPGIPGIRRSPPSRPGRRGHFTHVKTMAKCPRLPSKTHGTRLTPTETYPWAIVAPARSICRKSEQPARKATSARTARPGPNSPARPVQPGPARTARPGPNSPARPSPNNQFGPDCPATNATAVNSDHLPMRARRQAWCQPSVR